MRTLSSHHRNRHHDEAAAERTLDKLARNALVSRWVVYPTARWGYRRYLRTEETPPLAYRAMRKLFASADRSLFQQLQTLADGEQPALELVEPDDGIAAGTIEAAVQSLRADGYVVLPNLLDEARCAALEACARAAICTLIDRRAGAPTRARFDEHDPCAVRYEIDEEDITQCDAAQQLIADRSLLAVAQRYLGTTPVQDLVTMWWTVGLGGSASADAAQQFHFDLDRLRFLKIFVYLTDVTERTGPHVYVRRTHIGLPPEFRHDHRYPDPEVKERFGDDIVEIGGPRGTVFLADTRGLHKGLPLVAGYRLVFQLEFANSLFGQSYGSPHITRPVPEFVAAHERFPRTFRRFVLRAS